MYECVGNSITCKQKLRGMTNIDYLTVKIMFEDSIPLNIKMMLSVMEKCLHVNSECPLVHNNITTGGLANYSYLAIRVHF